MVLWLVQALKRYEQSKLSGRLWNTLYFSLGSQRVDHITEVSEDHISDPFCISRFPSLLLLVYLSLMPLRILRSTRTELTISRVYAQRQGSCGGTGHGQVCQVERMKTTHPMHAEIWCTPTYTYWERGTQAWHHNSFDLSPKPLLLP